MRGLGVGIDLPWQGPYGIVDDRVSARTRAFFARHGHRFDQVFVSWQPRDRARPGPDAVSAAWEELFALVPHARRSLHQTALNLAGSAYDRSAIVDLTNTLIDRFGFRWVNEDLGCWSVGGRPLPYPQPPDTSRAAIDHCTAVCAQVDAALDAPLVVEFPGYETLPAGDLDAYDVFREIVVGAGCRCTLDTGHLLTWRWLTGARGEALLDDLERLPLTHCVEIHNAGVAWLAGAPVDAHHGVLAEAQLELTRRLMARCPNLQVVTYEDPRFDPQGRLPPPAERGLTQLEQLVTTWAPADTDFDPTPSGRGEVLQTTPWEEALQTGFGESTPFGARCRAQVLERSSRGIGTMRQAYAAQLDGVDDLDALLVRFVQSDPGLAWSEFAWATQGLALEDALGRFLAPGSDAHFSACARLLALHPDPPFAVPTGFHRAPGGWWALGGTVDAPVLHAALRGDVVRGPVTPGIAQRLVDGRPGGDDPVGARLVAMGLLAP